MSENPYQAPMSEPGPLTGEPVDRERLRKIAGAQRGLMFCILAYLAAIPAQFLLPPELAIWIGPVVAVAAVAGAVFVFLLALRVYGVALGIILSLLTLVPLLGLLILLVVNGKATSELKRNGIRIGLLGAKSGAI